MNREILKKEISENLVAMQLFRHPTWLYSNKKYFRPQKGTFWAKTGPFGAPGGPEEGRDQAKVCGNHEFNPSGAAGGS